MIFGGKPIVDAVFLGMDNSHQILLRWFLGAAYHADCANAVVCVRANSHQYTYRKDEEGIIWADSDRLPQNTILLFCAGGLLPKLNSVIIRDSASYFVSVTYPYNKGADVEFAENIRLKNGSKGASIALLIIQSPVKTSATDIDTPDDGIVEIRASLAKTGLSSFVLHCNKGEMHPDSLNISEMMQLLAWTEPWDAKFHADCYCIERNLSEAIDNLEFDYELDMMDSDLDDDDGPLGTEARIRMCSFSSVKQQKKETIWECYTYELARHLFPSNKPSPLSFAVMLYERVLAESFIPGWPVAADSKLLVQEIHDDLFRYMKKYRQAILQKRQLKERKIGTLDEHEYNQRLTSPDSPDCGIQEEFAKAASEYVRCEVLHLLLSRLEEKKNLLNDINRIF